MSKITNLMNIILNSYIEGKEKTMNCIISENNELYSFNISKTIEIFVDIPK